MATENGPMSGFRDLLAEDMIPRDAVLDTIKEVYESYGFVPLKTPALERYETLNGKYGEEGQKLMYDFMRGDNHVAMRYDQTVPLARVVAQYGSRLPSPYKRYALGEVWRGERPQASRYREFTQFDADTVGTTHYLADTEIIAMMSDAMAALDAPAIIRVNDRRLLDGLAQEVGADGEKQFLQLVGAIDKVEKIGQAAVLEEVGSIFSGDATEVVERYLSVTGTSEEKLAQVADLINNEKAHEAIESLSKILGALSLSGYTEDQVVFDQTIARGLDYYTGTIYETSLRGAEEIGSVCSGGRFDNLIEAMGGPSTPAVGTSIGVDRLLDGLKQLGKLKVAKTKTQVYVTRTDEAATEQYYALTQELRSAGIPAEMFMRTTGTKFDRQMQGIDRLGVPLAIIASAEELAKGVLRVKNMKSGETETIPREELVDYMSKNTEVL